MDPFLFQCTQLNKILEENVRLTWGNNGSELKAE